MRQVHNVIMDLLYAERTEEVEKMREITKPELKEIVAYCIALKCKEIKLPYEKYCCNCILSTIHEGNPYENMELKEIDEGVFQDRSNPDFFVLGIDREDAEASLMGTAGWEVAKQVSEKYF